MRGSIAQPWSKTPSRTKGIRRNLGDLAFGRAVNIAPVRMTLALKAHDPAYNPDATRVAGSGGCLELKPGQSRKELINLSRLYELGSAGNYSVVAIKEVPGGGTKPLSNKLSFTVLP
jgi:hypothetical protein